MSTEAPKTPTKAAAPAAPNQSAAPAIAPNPVRVHTGNLKSTYCNTCTANTTREEVVLNFGVNQNWDRGMDTAEVSLEHRIVLSPFAAKRLSHLLTKLVEEYETRYGVLN